jgi:hypothetical protein
MIYSVDTSALIELDNTYSYEVFPSLWDIHIINIAKSGKFLSSEEVKDDLKRGDDWLYQWLMNNCSEIFVPSTTQIGFRLTKIMNQFPNFGNVEKPNKNYSDPFVVALALDIPNLSSLFPDLFHEARSIEDVMVITYENATGNLNGPRIPDICKELGIRIGKLIDVFKQEKIVIGNK